MTSDEIAAKRQRIAAKKASKPLRDASKMLVNMYGVTGGRYRKDLIEYAKEILFSLPPKRRAQVLLEIPKLRELYDL